MNLHPLSEIIEFCIRLECVGLIRVMIQVDLV